MKGAKKNRKRGKQPYPTPPKFPCGCKAFRAADNGYKVKVLILRDGRRVCPCGITYRAIWKAVREGGM